MKYTNPRETDVNTAVPSHQEKKSLGNRDLRYLKGVGPERSRLLERLGVRSLEDMMYLFPRRYEDRSRAVKILELSGHAKELVVGRVVQKRLIYRRGGRPVFRLVIENSGTRLAAIWFNCAYLEKVFEVGRDVALYGNAELGASPQMIHPDYEILNPEDPRRIHTGRIVPVYPLTQDLHQRSMRALQYELLLSHLKELRDPVPPPIRAKMRLVARPAAMKGMHFPKNVEELDAAYRRLVFDEFFVIHLALAMHREKTRRASDSIAVLTEKYSLEAFKCLLPFEMTAGQRKAVEDVAADLAKPYPMHRLIQGDVGSGKTTVAAFGLWAVCCAGYQGVLMAPTEILVQQHYLTLSRLLVPAGIGVGILSQGQTAAQRDRTLSTLQSGECKVLVGTHSAIGKQVRFKKLGLAVVDEQHKFGVMQRELLKQKAECPNLLVMTATPIPRTLALTFYGELDISVISDVPKGRGRIQTLWVDEARRQDIYRFAEEEIGKGRQVFVVYPLVSASLKSSVQDAEHSHKNLQRRFAPHPVGLLHGQMRSEEKLRVMKAFRANEISVLVATSIIEVGLDVTNASVLIIENAECFGLSQLHQLRGRIGRGKHDSTCFVLSESLNTETVDRLRAFVQFDSGFDLAEEDLKLRGPGDFINPCSREQISVTSAGLSLPEAVPFSGGKESGQRQHGIPPLRIGDMIKDLTILEFARDEAFGLIAVDPTLSLPEHAGLRAEIRARFGKVVMAG